MVLNAGSWKTTILFALACFLSVPGCQRKQESGETLQIVTTSSGVEMAVIPSGRLEMGSSDGMPDEAPVHRVTIDSFWMDRFEVTQEQFRKYEIPDPSHFKGSRHPLDQINWTDGAIYCNERSKAEGLKPCYDEETWACDFEADGYRLPTEAEWEYACRAGSRGTYSFGSDQGRLKDSAWFMDNSGKKTHPVGKKTPNAWGLYDMHGNVSEWCNDFYDKGYYAVSPSENPRGPSGGKERVLRGGAWNSSAESCRTAYRSSDPSLDDTCLASDSIGFRCVRSAPRGMQKTPEKKTASAASRTSASGTGLVYDAVYLKHQTPAGHPESAERLRAITEGLKAAGLYSRLEHLKPEAAALKWLHTVHSAEYVKHAKERCEGGAAFLDSADVPVCADSYNVAVAAAGGVLSAVDAVMQGTIDNAFCAVRPPGHHALKGRAMGFCIFNNVAVGARYVQQKHGLARVLIVDWDVHHGNGTQAMFYDDPGVLYFGVHQWPFYPGTGKASETGSGAGRNATINVPLPAGSGDAEYVKVFEERLRPAALTFKPDFVFVSAGFDIQKGDGLGGMNVTPAGFTKLTRTVKEIAATCCGKRLVSVLEGGYGADVLASSVEAHVRTLLE